MRKGGAQIRGTEGREVSAERTRIGVGGPLAYLYYHLIQSFILEVLMIHRFSKEMLLIRVRKGMEKERRE